MDDKVARWENPPSLPSTHYVDNRIFTDPEIFAEEQERIFAGVWKLVCHESELSKPGSYRAVTLGGRPLIVIRGHDEEIRTFFNICPHRGAPLVRDERGTFKKRIQCFYHLWTYDLEGNCTGITRPVGYEPVGMSKENIGLRQVRTELIGGLVFVSIENDVEPLEDFLGPIANHIRLHLPGDQPLEVPSPFVIIGLLTQQKCNRLSQYFVLIRLVALKFMRLDVIMTNLFVTVRVGES